MPPAKAPLTTLLLGSLLATSAPAALALQRIDAHDGVSVEAAIALKEPTRIKIDGAAISDVFGNIYSTNCGNATPMATIPSTVATAAPINPVGEVVLECDKDKGEIYVKPVAPGTKPINLFVSSGKATYTLILKRVDMPADTIVIVDRSERPAPSDAPARAAGPAPNHERALKTMLIAMAGERTPSDLRFDEVNRPLELWAEARLVLLRPYEGRGVIGETYRLTNISPQPMVLAEEEFDREDAGVVAVSIETHQLAPGESTHVFAIRQGDAAWHR
jgi:conjugal transfer pilus assembly protein TraK